MLVAGGALADKRACACLVLLDLSETGATALSIREVCQAPESLGGLSSIRDPVYREQGCLSSIREATRTRSSSCARKRSLADHTGLAPPYRSVTTGDCAQVCEWCWGAGNKDREKARWQTLYSITLGCHLMSMAERAGTRWFAD